MPMIFLCSSLWIACNDARDPITPPVLERRFTPASPLLTEDTTKTVGDTAQVRTSSLAFACKEWRDPISGLWSDATKWSGGTVPGASDNVCITVDGTYKVSVRGAHAARTVTVGNAGNVGVQTLAIEGVGTGSVLTVGAGVENMGVVQLQWASGNNATATTLVVTDGVLNNTGTLRVLADGIGAPRTIRANLLNTGTVSIQHHTTFDKPNGVYENRGTFTITRSLGIQGNLGQTFRQAGGTLTLGTMTITQETFQFDGGTITGRPVITNGHLRIGAGSAGAGDFSMRGASTIAGDIAEAQTVRVHGVGTGSTLTAAAGFTNAGLIEMQWVGGTNGTATTLVVTDGVLNNTGTLRVLTDGIGAPRTIRANLLNTGTVSIQHHTAFNKPNGVYENRGSFTVTRRLDIQGNLGQTFRQAGGTLTLGTMTITQETFQFDGGTITGRPLITNGHLRIGAGSAGAGDFSMRGASTIAGDIAEAQTVRVHGVSPGSTLTAAAGFTNAGFIEMQWLAGTNGTATTLVVTDGVLNNTGTLRVLADGIGAPRTIRANLLNTGTVSIQHNTTFTRQGGVYVNDNVLSVVGGNLTITGQDQTFVTTGQITGGRTLVFNGITLRASGSIAAIMNLTNVNTHIGVSGPASLDVTGNYRMITGGSLNIELHDPTPGIGFDRLRVSGTATLLGTLNVSVVDDACLEGGQSYEFMTFGLRSGDFATKNGLNLGGGRTLQAVPGATNYRLDVAGPPCTVPDETPPLVEARIAGSLGNNGWYIGDVTVNWTVSDAESDIVSTSGCGDQHVSHDTQGITFTCSATSAGGTSTESVVVTRDATAPVAAVSRSHEPNAAGWYNTDVTVTYTATDATSGIDGAAGMSQTFALEAANQSGSHTFFDRAGNQAIVAVTGINLDRTPPHITYSGNLGTYTVEQEIAITCTASDALSRLASSTCTGTTGAAYTFEFGPNAFSAAAVDYADNTSTVTTSFTVSVSFAGLCALTQRFVTNPGIAQSLCEKLNAAARARTAQARAGQLGAYVNQVQAQAGKALTHEHAAILIRLVQAL